MQVRESGAHACGVKAALRLLKFVFLAQYREKLAAERQRKLDSGEFVEPELPRFSEVYWKRQGQRANALFGDLQMAVGGAYGAARAKVNDASRDARPRGEP